MEDVEPSSDAWNREWKSSMQIRSFESLEPSSDTWNREWRSSSIVRSLESEMKVSSQVPTLEIGNGRVRGKFEAWNRQWKSSS